MERPKTAPKPGLVEQVLPVVLEIIPGQAAEGLIDVLEPGSYEERPLRKLCEKMLGEGSRSIEELQIVEDIRRQLDGGVLLCRGRRIDGAVLDHAVLEETESGEKYLYVPVRAIKPQEGGRPQAPGRSGTSGTPAEGRAASTSPAAIMKVGDDAGRGGRGSC